jgi:hypothetical protein
VDNKALTILMKIWEEVRSTFTAPGFENFIIVFSGWVLTTGPHAVTAALVACAVAGERHHEAFHRFFSRGTWDPDKLGRHVFDLALRLISAGEPLRFALDDTIAPKKGGNVFGIGTHIDAVRSTAKHKVFCFGHCWVILTILVRVPFSKRTWALPILFRLYRSKKECAKHHSLYKKKTELAREMLDVLVTWCDPAQRIEIVADMAYCNATVTEGLPSQIVLIGAMRPDAVLTAEPTDKDYKGKGRYPVRGATLRKPYKLAEDDRTPWKKASVEMYGRTRDIEYKECLAQWYRACGTRLLRIVVVKELTGQKGIRAFFSMDPKSTATQVLESYSLRWGIEVTFRDLKQIFGFADSSARKPAAVERTAPFVGYCFSLLVLWCAFDPAAMASCAPPIRPWYKHKQGLSSYDLLRGAQRTLEPIDILDLANKINNLTKQKTVVRKLFVHRIKRLRTRWAKAA